MHYSTEFPDSGIKSLSIKGFPSLSTITVKPEAGPP